MIKSDTLFTFLQAALSWFDFGFAVIPLLPDKKQTAVKWDPWLDTLSKNTIIEHWTQHPNHEVGFIVGDDFIIFDADTPQAIAELALIEKTFDIESSLTVNTDKGVHHYFRRPPNCFAKNDAHSSEQHPERIDVKTGRGMVILPPSKGKVTDIEEAENANDLIEITQEIIDAIFKHNGRAAPRPLNKTSSPKPNLKVQDTLASQIRALLNCIDPDCGYDDWISCGMAAHHETKGSDEGLIIFNDWSEKGSKYPGYDDIAYKWNSFNNYNGRPITIAFLKNLVEEEGYDWIEVCSRMEPGFEKCKTIVEVPEKLKPISDKSLTIPLERFSLRGLRKQIKKSALEEIVILGQIILLSQFSVIYAAPNTGKTLLIFWLLLRAIENGIITPSNIYYIDVDDTLNGLLEKLKTADEYGFNMLAEGYMDFKASDLLDELDYLITNDLATGVIIILDTLKKVTDLMDKKLCSRFDETSRRFVMKGGTIIALAHVNKHFGRDGKPIPAGTSDVIDDCDCAYILYAVGTNETTKTVRFENKKKRGNVTQYANYSYSIKEGITYDELLESVVSLDDKEVEEIIHESEKRSDEDVIEIITACILDGITTKMELAEAVSACAKTSKRAAINIIEKYTGTDTEKHLWHYDVQEHGRKVYRLTIETTGELL